MRFQDILNEQRFQFTVDGYGYNEEEDFAEPDEPSKKWHYMTTPQGERITLDHSPYQWMDKDEFAGHVAKHKAGLSEDRNAQHEMNPREYAAFVYGVEWGNSAQYGDGGYDSKELPGAYKDWIDSGRKGYYDESLEERSAERLDKLNKRTGKNY